MAQKVTLVCDCCASEASVEPYVGTRPEGWKTVEISPVHAELSQICPSCIEAFQSFFLARRSSFVKVAS